MRRSLLCLPALTLLLACRGGGPAGTPLFRGLESGLPMEEVQSVLKVGAGDWHPVDEYNPPRGRGTGLRLQRVELRRVSLGEAEGRLVLTFFNDRLLRTRFHPADFPRYRRAVAEREGLDLAPGSKLSLEPATEVRVLRDHEGATYVVWEDRDLQAQWDAVTKRW